MPKILLIQTTQYCSKSQKPCKQSRLFLPGLVFPLLVAMTPKHWKTEVCIEVTDEVDFDTDADLIGIGAMGHAVFRANDIAKIFKQKGKTVFMGGYMPSMLPDFVDAHTDGVIIGDAEISYPQLLKDFEQTGKIKKRYINPVINLDGLPVPKYEILTEKKIGFMLPVQAGRGCPHLCSYCSIACMYKGKYIARPVNEVLNDIKRVKELGYKHFYLLDDNIIGNQKFLEELSDEIKPLKMKWASQCSILLAKNPKLLKKVSDSGCRMLSLGIESITQTGLDKLNKNWVETSTTEKLINQIADAGILPATEMMLGTDSDTEESIRETFNFVMRTKIPIPKFYVLTPMPGTPLYAEYKQKGKLMHEDYSQYTATNCVHRPEKISPEKLTEMYWWLYRKTYSLPNILRRTIFHKRFFKRPLEYIFAFGVNISYLKFIRNGDAPNIF